MTFSYLPGLLTRFFGRLESQFIGRPFLEPVQIEMVERQAPAAVDVLEREGRARHAAAVARSFGSTFSGSSATPKFTY